MLYVPPLFLFSATFYPVSANGDWSWAVHASPLYHGVDLVRAANLGVWQWDLLVHAGVLVALGVAGTTIAAKRIEKLLLG